MIQQQKTLQWLQTEEMIRGWEAAQNVLASDNADNTTQEKAMEKYLWEMDKPEIVILDDYVDGTKRHETIIWSSDTGTPVLGSICYETRH